MTPEEIEKTYNDESPEKAEILLTPLGESGDPIAQFYLGHLCDEKSPPDRKAAVEWYRKSSKNGSDDATHFLASFMYYGFGTTQDVEGALRLFRKLAECGVDASQWRLGRHLVEVPETRDEGILWLSRAAEQGHPSAQEELLEIKRGKHA